MKILLTFALVLFATVLGAQNAADEAAIRKLIEDESTAWNDGDAEAYSRNFATDGTFTNILGMFFTGHQAFLDRHEEIFKGMFRGTVARQDIVSVKFVRADVAVVETLTWISGFSKFGPPPGAHTDAKGRLCTRLLQVLVRDGGKWRIASYHNTDVKPGTPVPEPK